MLDLTIGMATYDDFNGVYFTVQALRAYHRHVNIEIIVVDNFGCNHTKEFISNWSKDVLYIRDTTVQGTAYPRDLVFKLASSKNVLCIDSHVLLLPGSVERLVQYYKDNPNTVDLLQGPMYYDDLVNLATHMDPVWREQMFGIWGFDPRVKEGKPFEIKMHGLGLFSCRKEVWPGFNPFFRGFGGEEGYIHTKFRRRGGRCVCLPWLGWIHRFVRPGGTPYNPLMTDKIKNYLLGWIELGLPLDEIYNHFSVYMSTKEIAKHENTCRKQIGIFTSGGLKHAQ